MYCIIYTWQKTTEIVLNAYRDTPQRWKYLIKDFYYLKLYESLFWSLNMNVLDSVSSLRMSVKQNVESYVKIQKGH